MIVLDVNLLIHAVNEGSPLHPRAKLWLETVLSGTETVGFTWTVVQAFLRLTTRSGLFQAPLTPESAFDIVGAWLSQPSVIRIEPGGQHLRYLRDLLSPLGTAGNLTTWRH